MFVYNYLTHFGRYLLLMKRVFTRPDRPSVFFRQFIRETQALVIDSIGIVCLISLFIGAVCCIQIQLNIYSPLLPNYTVGFTTREILMLEFSSAIMSLILAGKVGSNIASEIGTMRITEQIDALEIMGINSANYLILPKICALVFFMPILVILSIAFGLFGGGLIAAFTHAPSLDDYIYGIQTMFREGNIYYSLEKSYVFAFLISSISAYWGYYTKGGALEVGKASTQAVVTSSIMILLSDIVLTQILL
jgi:phospholipid/cholesterol/gamma-HCH transport system permease protein